MPWRCATSCATAPRGPDTHESDLTWSDIAGPHHQREEILPCRSGDFDHTAEHVVFRPAHARGLVVLVWLDGQECPFHDGEGSGPPSRTRSFVIMTVPAGRGVGGAAGAGGAGQPARFGERDRLGGDGG